MSVRERLTCRLCGYAPLRSVFKLPDTPLANEFVAAPRAQEKYPLEVMLCTHCGHSQLRHVVDPNLMFTDYAYASGTSPTFVKHFEEYANAIDKLAFDEDFSSPFAVEIGSNDGTLLKQLRALGWRVLGVEPAKNLADISRAAGIGTCTGFFTESAAQDLVELYGTADVLVANNVLAHVDDLDDIMRGVKTMLRPDGVFVFEVQYLGDLLLGGMFDMVYHEHLDYHTVSSLLPFLHRHNLDLFDVDHVDTHGGSIRCWVQRRGGPRQQANPNIISIQHYESTQGILDGRGWAELDAKVENTRIELRVLLDTFQHRRAKVVAYGAPAKLTTFMYGLGLTASDFDYVVDDSPLKQGKFTPGLNIPVVTPGTLIDVVSGWPDAVLIAAWNFAPQILQKLRPLIDGGTHVITPFPTITVTE